MTQTLNPPQEKVVNYVVTVRSRLGKRSEILDEPKYETGEGFEGLLDALDYIRRQSERNGWRDFELETVADTTEPVPLRGKETH